MSVCLWSNEFVKWWCIFRSASIIKYRVLHGRRFPDLILLQEKQTHIHITEHACVAWFSRRKKSRAHRVAPRNTLGLSAHFSAWKNLGHWFCFAFPSSTGLPWEMKLRRRRHEFFFCSIMRLVRVPSRYEGAVQFKVLWFGSLILFLCLLPAFFVWAWYFLRNL